MKTHRIWFVVISLFAALAACQTTRGDLGGGVRVVAHIHPEENGKIDILFVIDNSLSMSQEQANLTQWAESSLFGVLTNELNALGEAPNLHIGVVTSDVGVGGNNVGGCAGAGDNGLLQNSPDINQPNCPVPGDRFIEYIDDGNGNVQTNYTGTLGEVFSCIAIVGTTGCGFEQHFESARRALDGTNAQNAGFLRADALLLVVFVADEDDCSASDAGLFDATQTSITDPLGPLTSFRCYEFGVQCDGGSIARTPAAYSSCESWETSSYISSVGGFASFLTGLKTDPSMVMVTGIFGPPDPLEVVIDQSGFPGAAPSCSTGNGMAFPGTRMQDLLDLFPARSRFDSICRPDFNQPLQDTAQLVVDVASKRPCLHNVPDLDAQTAGIQYSCRAFDVEAPGTPQEARAELSSCDVASAPCFRIVTDAATCGHTASTLAVQVDRPSPAPAGTHIIVECATN